MLDLFVQLGTESAVFVGCLFELGLECGVLTVGLAGKPWQLIGGGLSRTGEDAVQRVVVLGRYRVEFVVVTSGAPRREAKEPAGNNVDAVVDDFVREKIVARTDRQKAKRGQRLGVIRVEQISGELLNDELIERQVFVEGADDVVAVSVGERVLRFAGIDVAFGVGVAGDVEPVTPPALAVRGRCKQTLNSTRQRARQVGGGFRLERHHLVVRRRQAGEVEGCAAKQRPCIGPGRGRKLVGFEFAKDEVIDRRAWPSAILHGRNGGIGNRLKRPVTNGIIRRLAKRHAENYQREAKPVLPPDHERGKRKRRSSENQSASLRRLAGASRSISCASARMPGRRPANGLLAKAAVRSCSAALAAVSPGNQWSAWPSRL